MASLRNPRHELFARHRAKLVGRLEAYKLAGYVQARIGNAAKLERDERIKARIRELAKAEEELVEVEVEMMKRELRRIGYGNAVAMWEQTADGLQLKDITTLPESMQAMISEVVVDEGHVKVKCHPKLEALSQLAKLLGIEKPAKVEIDAHMTHRAIVRREPLSPEEWAMKHGGELIEAKALP